MTPLCDVLRNYAARNPARFHMPGHKGGPLPLPELSDAARLDVTEIPGTGNLYLAGEPYKSGLKAQGCGKLKKAVFTIELDPDEEEPEE